MTLTIAGVATNCDNADSALCNYQTTTAATPKVTSSSVSGGTLTLTGSDFPSGYTISVELGKQIVTGTRVSATSITATIVDGPGDVLPVVEFEQTSSPAHKHWATVDASANLDNAVTFGSTPSVTCSFAGGCNLDLSVAGLNTLVTNGEATVSVCGSSCTPTSASTDSTFQCELPMLATQCTYEQGVRIHEDGPLTGTYTADSSNPERAFDGSTQVGYTSTATSCNIQITMDSSKIGIVKSARYFITNMSDKSQYQDRLVLKGISSAGAETTLYTADSTVTDGWNSIDVPSTLWKYPTFKLEGSASGACNVAELELKGVALDAVSSCSASHTKTCDVDVNVRNGEKTGTSSGITYDLTKTPKITAVSPLYVGVNTAAEVTITGSGFGTTQGDVTVTIDSVTCTVSAVSDTSITCTSGIKATSVTNTEGLVVKIASKGRAANQGNDLFYVRRWSHIDTWSGDLPP